MFAQKCSTHKIGTSRHVNLQPSIGHRSRVCTTRALRLQCNAAAHTNVGIKLMGVGSAVPEKILTNADLEKLVETNDEWITTRTGIKKRHILGEGESLSQLAATASQRALEMAGVAAEDVDLIILATSSPDDLFGSACAVQALIGAKKAAAFDLTAACSGFVMALITASQYVRAGTYKNVVVIGADALSRYIDWRDRSTCILFGDGCGAVVVSANPDSSAPCSFLGQDMHSDGNGQKNLNALFAGPGNKPDSDQASSAGSYCNIAMNGQEVFKFAVRAVPTVIEGALKNANMSKDEIDWLVLHQANMRILNSAAERLGVPADRVVANLPNYGNTSAASIPLALDEAVRKGDIKAGQTVAMAGFGAGLSWASAIVRWALAAVASAAASDIPELATILNIILDRYDGIFDRDTSQCLREVCKAAKDVIDSHVTSFSYVDFRRLRDSDSEDEEEYYLQDIRSPWPWPNLKELQVITHESQRRYQNPRIGGTVEFLASIPWRHLRKLSVYCASTVAIAEGNWPILTHLELDIYKGYDDLVIKHPNKFPDTWQLKTFKLRIDSNEVAAESVGFLPALLKTCKDLTTLKLELNSSNSKVANAVASSIGATSFSHLEILDVAESHAGPQFFKKILEANLPALEKLFICQSARGVVPIIASKPWIANLVELKITNTIDATAEQLCRLLDGLEKSPIKTLTLQKLKFSTLVAFKDIKLEHLTKLSLIEMKGGEIVWDISACINCLFDSCSMPRLVHLTLGSVDDVDDLHMDGLEPEDGVIPRWQSPPQGTLPLLKKFNMHALYLPQTVGTYLGDWSRATGLELNAGERCDVEPAFLSEDRVQFLRRLEINLSDWEHYATDREEHELFYWNTLSNKDFSLVAFASAIMSYKDKLRPLKKKLKNFVQVVEAFLEEHEEGEPLVDFLKRLLKEKINPRIKIFAEQDRRPLRLNIKSLIHNTDPPNWTNFKKVRQMLPADSDSEVEPNTWVRDSYSSDSESEWEEESL